MRSTTDHRQLVTLSERLAAAQAAVDEAEQRWMALAEEAEGRGLDV